MPPATPFRLGFVSVHVSDLARARGFYEKLLGLEVAADLPDQHEVIYRFGPTYLSVHVDTTGECGRLPGGETGFYLQVDDAERAEAELRAAGARVTWREGRAFVVEDPDGNGFAFWQARQWPPQG